MFVILTISLLAITAIVLIALHWSRPKNPYSWLVTAAGTFMAWVSVLFWQLSMPQQLRLPLWQPESLFSTSPTFLIDGISWVYAFSLVTLALAVILTATIRNPFPNPGAWAGILILTMFGVIAVIAENPLTLVLAWSAIDLAELLIQLRSVNGPKLSENVVVAFAARVAGSGLVMWAAMVSLSAGTPLDFLSPSMQAGPYLLVAAGLRMGIFPLHLPYTNEPALRLGLGTTLRLVSAASSLILLARIPIDSISAWVTLLLMGLTTLAAIYAAWMWFRSSDILNGRPFFMIGMASLAISAALRGNATGSAAWGISLILAGGLLFLYSVRQTRLTRILLVIGIFGLSALPFSVTATGWQNFTQGYWVSWLLLLPSQALLIAGFIRHMRRTSTITLNIQPHGANIIYPIGLALLALSLLGLGFIGWDGSLKIGLIWAGAIATAAGIGFLWLIRKLDLLPSSQSAHWLRSNSQKTFGLTWLYNAIWGIYRLLGRISDTLLKTLEGDGGFLWSLLLMLLLLSILAQGNLQP